MLLAEVVVQESLNRLTRLLDELDKIHTVLAVVEGIGATDPERIAVLDPYFTEFAATLGLTKDEYFLGIAKARELRTWWTTAANYKPMNRLRVRT